MAVLGEGVRGRGLRKFKIDKARNISVLRTHDASSDTDGNIFFNNLVSIYPQRKERVKHGIL